MLVFTLSKQPSFTALTFWLEEIRSVSSICAKTMHPLTIKEFIIMCGLLSYLECTYQIRHYVGWHNIKSRRKRDH